MKFSRRKILIASPFVLLPKSSISQVLQFSGAQEPSSQITNGIQLTIPMTGPQGILSPANYAGYPGNLKTIATPGRGYFAASASSEFVPAGSYVYNNNINNNGGTVASDMLIDGYLIPAGTKVVQFVDFSGQDFYIDGSTSIMWRGCRSRGPGGDPGWMNMDAGQTGRLWFFFNDVGGFAPCTTPNQRNWCFDMVYGGPQTYYRNYLSYFAQGIKCVDKVEITENYIEKMTDYGGGAHCDMILFLGGQTCALILRNNAVNWRYDDQGREINQTDCQAFLGIGASYTGSGTNRDGSTGYKMDNNYYGGTGYPVYTGAPSSGDQPTNMKWTNNLFSKVFPTYSGFYGNIAYEPIWGSNGNLASNNRWADGPSQGQVIFGSP